MLADRHTIQRARTRRFSSWFASGCSIDAWQIRPGETHLVRRTACRGQEILPIAKRMPVFRDNLSNWLYNPEGQVPSRASEPNEEMQVNQRRWQEL